MPLIQVNKSLRQLALVFAVLSPIAAFCWGTTGHRVIGEIAQEHLSKKAKTELRKLIGNETLQQWSNWADFIKSDTTHTWDHTSKWHYVNIPGNLDRTAFDSDLHQQTGENLFTQIKAQGLILKNKQLPVADRQIALRFFIHLVGDLHQPLHVGRAEDLGGNKIKLTWFDKTINLHSLWDNTLVEFQQYSYSEYAKTLNIASKNEVKQMQEGSLEDWFFDSYQLANKVYASTPAESKLSYRYNYEFQKDLDSQLLKGGLRLAKLLNELWD